MDFTIWGPIAREDLPGLCDRVCTLLTESGRGNLRCDVDGVRADAVTVDALARLTLHRALERVDTPHLPARQDLVPPSLVVRGSSGPPP